jgi:predicted O-methyltransferase YrrM
LADRCQILRTTSRKAARSFAVGSIDVVHIDGRHDRRKLATDAARWVPKIRPGGIAVFDDSTWGTVRPVINDFPRKETLVDAADGLPEDFVIIQIGTRDRDASDERG